jgi:YbbR domain-containing protein
MREFLQEVAAIAGAILRPAAKSVRENSGLAVLSIVLAFGLWIFVTDAENPERTVVPTVDIPVEPVNVPPDVVVAEELATVRVRVRVEENVVDSLTKEDFQATVDVDGLTVGVYTLPVEVRPLTTRGNLRIVAVLPEEIDVRLAQLLSKTVPVKVEMRGTPASEFTLVGSDVETETAVVAGPQEGVSAVTEVVASVDMEGRTESFEGAVKLEPRNQQGVLVENVTVDPAAVDVQVEIEQTTFSRALAVSPVLEGAPRQGYNVVGIAADPLVVTVFGPETYIEAATTIPTQPVDVDDATEDVVRTVSLDLPTGVTVNGGASVTVTVEISAAPGQLTFAVPVTANGLGDNLSIVGTLPAAQVFVFGPLPELLELDPNDISATIDLGGKDAGTHTVKVDATVPEGLEVRAVTPQEIQVQLESR